MAFTEQQLAQARENSTSAVSVFSPIAGTIAIIKTIMIANTTAASADVTVYVDDDGTTYDESTTIIPTVTVGANSVLSMNLYIPMNNSSGNFAYKSSVANALTITLFGAVIS